MTAARAIVRGFGLALSSAKLLALIWVVALLLALPASLALSGSLRESIGASRVHEELREGFDLAWFEEFRHRARGLERTLEPSRLGGAAVLDNLEAWFSGELFTVSPLLVALGALYALVWAHLVGGILERMARRHRAFVLRRFLGAGAGYFPRFLRLVLMAGVLYFLVYRLARRLFPWLERLTRDVTSERAVLGVHLLGAVAIVLLLVAIKVTFDYAKIATVLEGRRSMLGAALAGLRFLLSHPLRSAAVALAVGAMTGAVMFVYFRLAPHSGSTVPGLLLAFLVGQLYLLSRIVLRLVWLGGQLELYLSLRDAGRGMHRRSW